MRSDGTNRALGATPAPGISRPQPRMPRAAPSQCGVTFAAGIIAGIVVTALVGLFVFQARVISGDRKVPRPDLRSLVAVAALVVAIIALVRSGDNGSPASDTTPRPTDQPVTTVAPTISSTTTSESTTSTTVLRDVTVPNVVGMTQTTAAETLTRAGLRSHVQTLPLTNVPAGFVVTQTPMAFSTTTSGAIVSLGVSVKA